MDVRVLGPVELVTSSGEARALGSRSQRLVLAVLAAHLGHTVDAGLLVDALWGDDPPRTAMKSLRTYVSRLRQLLGDALAIRPAGYSLMIPPDRVDSERFEHLVQLATSASGPGAVERFAEALALWRGQAFGDLADEPALRAAALRLEELRLAAEEGRARALVSAGRAADAAAEAEALVAQHPLREGSWAALVEALTASDRVPEALRAYQRATEVLADAGLVPSPRLREAEALAFAIQRASLSPRRFPQPASTLVGRDADLARVSQMLESARVVTLTGPGGVGKTRLALEVATRNADLYARGTRLVQLGEVDDPASVTGLVVDALGLVVDAVSGMETLAAAGDLDLLVVLDNCEHVLDQAARAVETLVTGGRRVRVLATSRQRLGIDGEHVWPVNPLPLQGAPSAAHQLFMERAQAVHPDLTVNDEVRAAVDRIVARLDGLPLAIEMAAARTAALPVTELAEHLTERLDLVDSTLRPTTARHRTLGTLVEWSEALLDDAERELFAEMAVFASPVVVDDISAVTGRSDPLETLARLADHSLLVADTRGTSARFGMLQTVRAHAGRRLAALDPGGELSERHARHLLAVTAQADRELRCPAEADASRRLDELGPELRLAYQWGRQRDKQLAFELTASLWLFGVSRLRDEPLRWAEAMAGQVQELGPLPLQAPGVLASAAQRAVNLGDLNRARELAERGITLAGSRAERRFPLEVLADILMFQGHLDAAAERCRQLLDAADESGDLHAHVNALTVEALTAAYAGSIEEAQRLLGMTPALASLAPSDQGWVLFTEGEIFLDREPDRALAALERAIALADTVNNRYLGGVARLSACSLRARIGEPSAALDAFASVIEHWRRQGAMTYQLTTLRNLVILFGRAGCAAEAAELLGTTQSRAVAPIFGDEAVRLAETELWARDVLGEIVADQRMAVGAARTVDDAALTALDWIADMHTTDRGSSPSGTG